MNKARFTFEYSRVQRFIFTALTLLFFLLAHPVFGESLFDESYKNRLVICTPSQVVSLDPTDYRGRDTQIVIKNIFDSLTARDPNMKVVPQLAEAWRVLNDTLWELKIRQGVKFHNGDDVTAEDVKFTLERVIKELGIDGQKTSPRKSLLGPISKVEAIDDYTVRIETKKPWPILPLMLTLQEIIPKKYLLAMGSKGFNKAPIGTGPFKFVRLESENLILRRFEEYYGGAPANPPVQKAPIERLVFRTVPVLANRIAMFKKGECDIITHVSPEVLPILKLVPQIRVLSHPATRSYFAELNVWKYPFSELRIRQAVNYAFDVQAYIDLFLKGHGTVLPTVLLPNAFAYHDTLKPYPYNPKLAKKLLHDAGYPEWYPITINSAEKYRQFANALAIFLSKMGLHPSVNIMQKTDARLSMARLLGDILVTSWGNSTLDPVGIIMPKFKSGGRGNFSNYRNKEVDVLLSQAENTLDLKKRENYYKRIQEIIYKDAPMIFGYAAEEFYGVRKKVLNFQPSSSGMLNMHDVYIKNGD